MRVTHENLWMFTTKTKNYSEHVILSYFISSWFDSGIDINYLEVV